MNNLCRLGLLIYSFYIKKPIKNMNKKNIKQIKL